VARWLLYLTVNRFGYLHNHHLLHLKMVDLCRPLKQAFVSLTMSIKKHCLEPGDVVGCH
jgi:hypothetical protein